MCFYSHRGVKLHTCGPSACATSRFINAFCPQPRNSRSKYPLSFSRKILVTRSAHEPFQALRCHVERKLENGSCQCCIYSNKRDMKPVETALLAFRDRHLNEGNRPRMAEQITFYTASKSAELGLIRKVLTT